MAAVILHDFGCATLFLLDRASGMGGKLGQVPVPFLGATGVYLQHLLGWTALNKTWKKGKKVFLISIGLFFKHLRSAGGELVAAKAIKLLNFVSSTNTMDRSLSSKCFFFQEKVSF